MITHPARSHGLLSHQTGTSYRTTTSYTLMTVTELTPTLQLKDKPATPASHYQLSPFLWVLSILFPSAVILSHWLFVHENNLLLLHHHTDDHTAGSFPSYIVLSHATFVHEHNPSELQRCINDLPADRYHYPSYYHTAATYPWKPYNWIKVAELTSTLRIKARPNISGSK